MKASRARVEVILSKEVTDWTGNKYPAAWQIYIGNTGFELRQDFTKAEAMRRARIVKKALVEVGAEV